MTDRRKTALILGMTSLFMFSPLAMSLFWHPIPMFQNLGFERESIAPPLAWILATITAIAYVLYTMKAIPLVLAKQREISLFKLLGILSAWSAASSKKSSFDVGPWICSCRVALIPSSRSSFPASHLVWHITSWTLLAKRDFKATLPAILSTSILGIFLAIIYLAGGRNLGPCIFAHVLINIVIEPWLMLSAVSGKWRNPEG